MVTPKREWFAGVSYHITSRGNHRNDIFRDEADFSMYLILMKECLKYYEKYNYKLIRKLHSMYSRYFNKKYNYIAHLWQDKYFWV